MSDKLLREEIDRRMNNWAMAMAGGYRGGATAPGFMLAASNQVRQGSTVPILYGEADETAKVLAILSRPQFDVLCLHFVDRPPMHARYQVMKLTKGSYCRLVVSASKKFWKELNELKRKERFGTLLGVDGPGKKTTIPGTVV